MKLFVTPRTTTFDTAEIPIAEHVATAMFPHGLPSPSPPPIILSNLHILLDSKPGVVCHKGAFKNEVSSAPKHTLCKAHPRET